MVTTALAAPPPVPIAQLPMTIAVPAHPQVVFAVGNSESMDQNLAGANMVGSGLLGGAVGTGLANSSSPATYTIPSGFTPPLNAGSGGVAPYTVSLSTGYQADNSPSRLNIAKAGMTAVLNEFMQYADFALVDYAITEQHEWATSVYYMSPAGQGFTFTSTPGLNRVVNNPCYNANTSEQDAYDASCSMLQGYYGANVITQPYMIIGASSDDPGIDDVLYWSTGVGPTPACVDFGGPNPSSPYSFTLGQYESGHVTETYTNDVNVCVLTRSPTDSGYVPYSQEVMYAQRGWGWGGASLNFVRNLVSMQSSGATPTPNSVAHAIAQFTPYLQPETNSPTWGTGSTVEIRASGYQSAAASLVNYAMSYYTTNNPPSTNGCTPTRYIVLVTDGLPTMDMSNNWWPPLGSAAATGYGLTATFNADGSLNSTNDQALTDAITQIGLAKAAGVKTFVIGLGAAIDPSLNPTAAATMTAMAVAGGTGNYFAATSPQAVSNDMQAILAQILSQTQSTSSAAVNSTGLRTGTVVYQSQFTTSDVLFDWTGELLAFPVDPATGQVNTTPSNALWSAKTQLQAQDWVAGRVIATWDPNANSGQGGGTPFEWNPGLAPAGISATTTLGTPLTTFWGDANGQDVLNYLRGDAALEQQNGGTFRNRTWRLGDIVDSGPLYVGPPSSSSADPTYTAFENTYATRPPVIYVGANDGMLHAIDAATGNERFAYIPNSVWNNVVNLADPYYNEQHQFFVDGSPTAADAKFGDGSWHTVLVGGESGGGQSIYALDVTNPAALDSEAALAAAVLWEFHDADMGDSFSVPAIVNTNAGWLAIFGNGYDSPNGIPVLYAVNIQTGALVKKIKLCNAEAGMCNHAVSNGLSSVTVVNSSGQLTVANNLVYAGDLQGNLWRVDISNASPALWAASVVFQARDPSSNPQPITTPPAVTLNPRYPALLGTMVFVGTGQLLGTPDLANAQIETVYGVYDPPSGRTSPVGPRPPGELVQQTLSSDTFTTFSGGSLPVRYVSNSTVALPTVNGWFVDLNINDGERSVTAPLVEPGGDLVFTTYLPNTSSCEGGGQSWLMTLNYANGGSFPTPQLDVYGNGQISSADTASDPQFFGQNAAGMYLGDVYATSPVVVSGGTGNTAPRHKLISESNTTLQSVGEAGPGHQRLSWWEVR
jgi:type IV pilus assembly protein PilY1